MNTPSNKTTPNLEQIARDIACHFVGNNDVSQEEGIAWTLNKLRQVAPQPAKTEEVRRAVRDALNQEGSSEHLGCYLPVSLAEVEDRIIRALTPYLRTDREPCQDTVRLELVRINALKAVGELLKFLPENPSEHSGLEYAHNAYLAHRILSTGEPDGALETAAIDAAASANDGRARG